jgi:peptidoglycan/xylan/chitin deacetylase (PgdA/CDA1 family)
MRHVRLPKRRLWLLLACGGVLAAAAAIWVFNPHRDVPLTEAMTPEYWVRHMRGGDQYDAQDALLERGDSSVPEVALTFDDGPDPRYGPLIAQLLKQKGITATFFVIGFRVKQHPEVLRQLVADGFEIGNHTYDHKRLPDLKPHEIANELRLCDRDIAAVTGQHPAIMRPPGVQFDDKVLGIDKALGYVTVSWTVGARDYGEEPPPSFIEERVLDRTKNGSIILLHQTSPSTLAALPTIIDGLQKRGFRFVTISAMLNRLHARLPAVPPSSPPILVKGGKTLKVTIARDTDQGFNEAAHADGKNL